MNIITINLNIHFYSFINEILYNHNVHFVTPYTMQVT